MLQMLTSPGPARRALTCGITPAEYADEMREAFETLAWIDRISRHRVGDTLGPRDPQAAAARLLAHQYHGAVQLADLTTSGFVADALDALVGPVAATSYLRADS